MLKYITYLLTFFLSTLYSQQNSKYTFIENKGQWNDNVAFKADLKGGYLYLEKSQLTFDFYDSKEFERYVDAHHHKELSKPFEKLKCHSYKVSFEGANAAKVTSTDKTSEYYNFFLGDDPNKWGSKAFGYHEVSYQELYKGIDLIYYTNQGKLKYDFIVKPNASHIDIKMKYVGVEDVSIKNERLVVKTSVNKITEEKPYAYQLIDGKRREVVCRFVLNNNIVSFDFPNGYDQSKELIIDPVLEFSTFSGSFSNNFGYTATFDRYGFLYSGSTAFGASYPTTPGAYDLSFNAGIVDVAISKYDTTGTFMVYSTFVGGSSDELPHSMIVNSNNELFVYGTTSSFNFPTTTGAYDNTFHGGTAEDLQNGLGVNFINGSDIFVFRLSELGDNLLASTLVGGSANDGLNKTPTVDIRYNYADEVRGEIEIDKNNNIYVVSCTRSNDFPVSVGAFQQTYGGGEIDGCVFKMDNQLTTLIWSSYIGGSANDAAYSLALSANDDPYITGGTVSPDFLTTSGVLNTSFQGGRSDAFVSLIDKSGNSIIYSTYFGSNEYDQAYFIEVDRQDNVHLFGQTEKTGTDFIVNASYSTLNSGQFVTKLTPDLTTITWSTVFGSGGGAPNISPTAFLVDVCSKIYLSGWGGATNQFATQNNAITTNGMDITSDAYQSTTDGSDFYLMVLEADASNIVYGSYFGGNISDEHVDGGTSRFDRNGKMYQSVCAGCGGNSDFPIEPNPGAVSATNNNSCNNGVFKFDFNLPITIADFDATPVVCVPDTTYFNNLSLRGTAFNWDFGDGNTSTLFEPKYVYNTPGTYIVTLAVSDTGTCNFADTIQKDVTVLASSTWSLGTDSICENESVQIGTTPNSTPGITYTWTPTNGLSDSTIANPIASPNQTTNYILYISNGVCTDTVYQTIYVSDLNLVVSNNIFLCESSQVTLNASSSNTSTAYHWSSNGNFTDKLNSGNDSTFNITPTTSVSYYIRIQEGNCSLTDTVDVVIFDDTIQLSGPSGICLGDTINLTTSTSIAGNISYSWSPNLEIIGSDSGSSVQTNPGATTWYYVTATDQNGCEIKDSIRIYVSPLPTYAVSASADVDTIIIGGSVNIHAAPDGFSYGWAPSSTLSSANSQHPIASPIETTTYTLSVSDSGCSIASTVTIYLREVICGPPDLYVPNAFSPDDDGFNDFLLVRGNNISEMKFSVFHRWGEKVFETTDQLKGWDGTFKGRPADPAVFVYYLEVTCFGQETYFEKGNVTLLR